MSLSTPTLKPTNSSSLKNIPPLKDLKNADNLIESQEKSQENIDPKIFRKASITSNTTNPTIYKNLITDHKNRYIPKANKEAIENINKIKEYKWKLGLILLERINNLKQEISEQRKKIEDKKKEFEKNNVYQNKIEHLQELIRKEQAEDFPQEYKTNLKLINQKKALEEQINGIEKKRQELKNNMKKKYQIMLELKDNLKKSLEELKVVDNQINSRKFIFDQEDSQKEKQRAMSQKLFYREKDKLHLSQTILDNIKQNILINDENNNNKSRMNNN